MDPEEQDAGAIDYGDLAEEAARAEGVDDGEPGPSDEAMAAVGGPAMQPDQRTKALVTGVDAAIRMAVGAPQRDGSEVEMGSAEGQLEFAATLAQPFSERYLGGVATSPVGGALMAVVFLAAMALADAAGTEDEEEEEDEGGAVGEDWTSGAELEEEPEAGGEASRAPQGDRSPKASVPTI